MDISYQDFKDSEFYQEKLTDEEMNEKVIEAAEKIDNIGIPRDLKQKIIDLIGMFYDGSASAKIAIIIAMMYAINPFDIIPDFIPVIGWADDAFVIGVVLNELSKTYKSITTKK